MDEEKEESLDIPIIDEPEREIAEYPAPKSISEEEEETPQRTDLQAVLRTLTPHYPDKILNEKLQPVMVSRIFPDNMLDSCKLTVLSRVWEHDPTKDDIDMFGIILATHGAHSIGYEGRGIVDRLEIAGVAHEQDMEKLSKELGL
jgi:hypothetical protein